MTGPSVPPIGASERGLVDRLATLVAGHCRTFPWYRGLLRERGTDHTAPLAQLPVVDEDLLRRWYYTRPQPALPGAVEYRTSGTTGGRKRILYTTEDHAEYVGHRHQVLAAFLRDVPAGACAVADLGTGHAAASARQIFQRLGLDAHDIPFSLSLPEHLRLLDRWRPVVLFTMPMILDRLLAGGLTARPAKVIVVGDLAPAGWRRGVARRLGITAHDVLDVYGSIEIGAIAAYDATSGLYRVHDHIVPEAVPRPDRLGEPGGTGTLLLTSFARRAFPAVRFATNDVVRGLRSIEWRGRTVHTFERLEGRHGGEVKHGERISQHDLMTAVAEVLPGVPFDVREGTVLRIRVGTERLTRDQADAVRSRLLAAAPDVAQMIDSGLVQGIEVVGVPLERLAPTGAKRRPVIRDG